jgi:hypothetical protein
LDKHCDLSFLQIIKPIFQVKMLWNCSKISISPIVLLARTLKKRRLHLPGIFVQATWALASLGPRKCILI